jgi:hypothetical protein
MVLHSQDPNIDFSVIAIFGNETTYLASGFEKLSIPFGPRHTVKPALGSHALFPRPPHLPERKTHIHVPIIQLVRFIDGKRYEAIIVGPKSVSSREGEQKWSILVRLILLLLGLGRRRGRGGRCCRLRDRTISWIGTMLERLIQRSGKTRVLWVRIIVMVVMADRNRRICLR